MSHHTLLHRIVRPSVRLLAGTRVRPNHLTSLRLTTATAAAVAFSTGSPGWIVVGAVLFTLSALLDRADGTLARMTGQFSRLGHRLDLIADCGADGLVFVAMGIGASGGWLGWHAMALGGMAGLATGVLFWLLNWPGAMSRPAPQARLFDPDDMILGVPLLACLVGLAPVLLLAGLITPLVALVLLLRGRVRGAAKTPSRTGLSALGGN